MVLGLHSICCGLPVAATLLASGAVGLVGVAALQAMAHDLHEQLHHYEGWILGVSALLVGVGGLAELTARRRGLRRFPAFFAVSVACLALNAGLVLSHRMNQPLVEVALATPAAAAPLDAPAPVELVVTYDHRHDHNHGH